MKHFFLALVFLVALVSSLAAIERVWTNSKGQTLRAELLSLNDDGTVSLKSVYDGNVYQYPIDELSQADREWLTEQNGGEDPRGPQDVSANRKAEWFEDFEEALAESKKYDLPILLLFTGSDWCGYCIKQDRAVFSEDEFQEYANKNLVLMKCDFPNKDKPSRSIQKQNKELSEEFGVTGFPTVFFIDADKKKLGRFGGYGGDSADQYVEKVRKLLGSK